MARDVFEFELVFELPSVQSDAYALSDAVFAAGYEDAVIGTGNPKLLGVELEAEGADATDAILSAAKNILRNLPEGTRLREFRPDLVSLADVAEKLNVKRQALQKRAEMPLPSIGGLYRIDELADTFSKIARDGGRKTRLNLSQAMKWLAAGRAARQLNARLTMHELDPFSLELRSKPHF